jgi:alkylation response protein AidB-like acyl-CoA dehydrogenase
MDFNDTPEEATYREKACEWLRDNAPKSVASSPDAKSYVTEAKAWQAKKAQVGYACITWPEQWGGPGGSAIDQVIFSEEEAKHQIPPNIFAIGLGMCLPTVMAFAGEATKRRFAPPAMRGEEIWCQLFSEPSGGSDVAAARTRAVQTNDGSGDWLINGQKVWTTGAQYSDFGIVIVRTDPNVPKHKGLTMFWVDMKDPGIDVRPIHQMSGGSEFNEVFFSDVRVKDDQRLGAVGEGWKVSVVTLMNERLAVGGNRGPSVQQLLDAARRTPGLDGAPAIKDQALREKIADFYVLSAGLQHTRNRAITALSRGTAPGPENSIGKIVSASQMQELAHLAIDMFDQFGIISDPAVAELRGEYHAALLGGAGLRIAGGTDEILRNIIAERVLGLPGDIRTDKDVPFKDVPIGR